MAYFKFVQAIDEGKSIDIYNHGQMLRDFTYVDDVVEGISTVLNHPPRRPLGESSGGVVLSNARYKIYNLGNHEPVELLHFVHEIEKAMGRKAHKRFLPMQAGDVPVTYAQMEEMFEDFGFRPTTSIEEGLPRFVKWFINYYSAKRNAA
jgi:UDP-glucuronate 4-epimerase